MGRVIPSNQLQTLDVDVIHVHLIVFPLGPELRRVPLFRVEKVRVIHLLEFQIIRFLEESRALLRRALAELPAVFDRLFPFATLDVEFDHYGIRVAVSDLRAREIRLDVVLRLLDHASASARRRRGDGDARKNAFPRARKTVDGVHRYLVRELFAVVHFFHPAGGRGHVALGLLPELFQFQENTREQARDILRELIRPGTDGEGLVRHAGDVAVLGVVHDQRRVTQVMRHHDRRVQGLEIERRDRRVVRTLLRL